MTAHELIVLAAMLAMAMQSKRIGEWFTAERGTAPGQNGWV